MRPTVLQRSILLAVWALACLGCIAWLVDEAYAGDQGCDIAAGQSFFGTASWGWTPPGVTCTFDLSPAGLPEHVDEPSPARWAILAGLVAWPVVTLRCTRRKEAANAPTAMPA